MARAGTKHGVLKKGEVFGFRDVGKAASIRYMDYQVSVCMFFFDLYLF